MLRPAEPHLDPIPLDRPPPGKLANFESRVSAGSVTRIPGEPGLPELRTRRARRSSSTRKAAGARGSRRARLRRPADLRTRPGSLRPRRGIPGRSALEAPVPRPSEAAPGFSPEPIRAGPPRASRRRNRSCSRRSLPDRWQPSPFQRRVGFRIACFEASSPRRIPTRPRATCAVMRAKPAAPLRRGAGQAQVLVDHGDWSALHPSLRARSARSYWRRVDSRWCSTWARWTAAHIRRRHAAGGWASAESWSVRG